MLFREFLLMNDFQESSASRRHHAMKGVQEQFVSPTKQSYAARALHVLTSRLAPGTESVYRQVHCAQHDNKMGAIC